jgi:signal transduction histidine kinase
MTALSILDASLAGLFAFAAVHYAVQWWFSRDERVFLVFGIQCGLYAAFSGISVARHQATTIDGAQATLDWAVTIGLCTHAVVVQFYALLARRRDQVFRALMAGTLAALAIVNLWAPIRGTITDLQAVQLPGGDTALVPISTGTGASLVITYVAVFAGQAYGCFVAAMIWKRDRRAAVLIAAGALAVIAGATVALLVDLAGLRSPYVGASPHAIFVVCMAVVLSREYAVRAEAKRASAAKTRVLASISHEIRTPLGAMMMYAQLLQRDRSLTDHQRAKIDIMFASGQHLAALLDDVLEMSRIESGRSEIVEEQFDLAATLDAIEQMFAGQAAAKGLTLTFEGAGELPRSLIGDGSKLRQVLINLVSNAVKFTSAGSVRVSTSVAALGGDSVQITVVVADTGAGIAAVDQERIFRPFERATTSRSDGTGLGLAISLAHARLMQGDLVVDSRPGVGSTFTFTCSASYYRPPT